jgi:hypothetical protein
LLQFKAAPLQLYAEENIGLTNLLPRRNRPLRGFHGRKDILGLFVPLNGIANFVRKEILEKLDGWDTTVLSEDTGTGCTVGEQRVQRKVCI